MAACELKGTLKYRDGHVNEFSVKTENNIRSMISGIQKLSSSVADALTDLVEQEKGRDKGDVDVEDDECDDDLDDDPAVKTPSACSPPSKRLKTQRT